MCSALPRKAAIIAASIMGANVDAHDAYLYFDKSENELLGTGAIRPSVVNAYMIDQGFYPESSDFNMIPNGTYITYYNWKKDGETGWHYQCFTANEDKLITCYNEYKLDDMDYNTYRYENNIFRVIGLAYYTNN